MLEFDVFPSGGRHLKIASTLTVFGAIRQPYQSLRSPAKIEGRCHCRGPVLNFGIQTARIGRYT